jgi:hypothetical protein
MPERGFGHTREAGGHPAGPNTSHGQLFVSLAKVSVARHLGHGNLGEVWGVYRKF